MPASPAALRAAADRLDELAGSLPTMLDSVAAQAGCETWLGPASDEFRLDLRSHDARVGEVADDYRRVARLMREEAGRIEAAEAAARQREREAATAGPR